LTGTHALIVQAPTGKIVFVAFNAPGAWCDSQIALQAGLYDIIRKMPGVFFTIGDGAFGQAEGHIRSPASLVTGLPRGAAAIRENEVHAFCHRRALRVSVYASSLAGCAYRHTCTSGSRSNGATNRCKGLLGG
jgi:hypothetical protein